MSPPDLTHWLEVAPYAMKAEEKSRLLAQSLSELTLWHRSACPEYARILDLLDSSAQSMESPDQIPFIPARLFKEFDLSSIDKSQIFKTLTSSGTSGQQVSRIYLDRETSAFQTRILSRLMSDIIGKKRVPMLIIDSPGVLRERLSFSARRAGVLGFSLFGQDVTYLLDENMELNLPAVEAFLERHAGQPVLLFGFTFIIWQHFYSALATRGIRLPLKNGILLHGGGWKKLQDQAVGRGVFAKALLDCAEISRVINYYGMVEQTGSIYLECEEGRLHASVYSDIIIRSLRDFQPLPNGEVGLVEVLSLIPRSYPGHALLTEDLGMIHGEDDCPCGRLGKHFTVLGRIEKAEARGCSDTYESRS
jgi:phenylacetate-coenzyme A ligase PaaK-like adenylate-forming protein